MSLTESMRGDEMQWDEWRDLRSEMYHQIREVNDRREWLAFKDTYYCPGIDKPLPVQETRF